MQNTASKKEGKSKQPQEEMVIFKNKYELTKTVAIPHATTRTLGQKHGKWQQRLTEDENVKNQSSKQPEQSAQYFRDRNDGL